METAFPNWLDRNALFDLRHAISEVSQQQRSEVDEDKLLELWNLFNHFLEFYDENFCDYSNLRVTSTIGTCSIEEQTYLVKVYNETCMLIHMFRTDVTSWIASDIVSPKAQFLSLKYAREETEALASCTVSSATAAASPVMPGPPAPPSTSSAQPGLTHSQVSNVSENRVLELEVMCPAIEVGEDANELDNFADAQNVVLLDSETSGVMYCSSGAVPRGESGDPKLVTSNPPDVALPPPPPPPVCSSQDTSNPGHLAIITDMGDSRLCEDIDVSGRIQQDPGGVKHVSGASAPTPEAPDPSPAHCEAYGTHTQVDSDSTICSCKDEQLSNRCNKCGVVSDLVLQRQHSEGRGGGVVMFLIAAAVAVAAAASVVGCSVSGGQSRVSGHPPSAPSPRQPAAQDLPTPPSPSLSHGNGSDSESPYGQLFLTSRPSHVSQENSDCKMNGLSPDLKSVSDMVFNASMDKMNAFNGLIASDHIKMSPILRPSPKPPDKPDISYTDRCISGNAVATSSLVLHNSSVSLPKHHEDQRYTTGIGDVQIYEFQKLGCVQMTERGPPKKFISDLNVWMFLLEPFLHSLDIFRDHAQYWMQFMKIFMVKSLQLFQNPQGGLRNILLEEFWRRKWK